MSHFITVLTNKVRNEFIQCNLYLTELKGIRKHSLVQVICYNEFCYVEVWLVYDSF